MVWSPPGTTCSRDHIIDCITVLLMSFPSPWLFSHGWYFPVPSPFSPTPQTHIAVFL